MDHPLGNAVRASSRRLSDPCRGLHAARSNAAPSLFVCAGEPSGDLHAANLIRALMRQSPGIQVAGYGGPRMRAAGCDVRFDLTELAVMWLGRAVTQLPQFWRLLSQLDRQFRHAPPDAVVLIDYPGFNWHVARCAKRHGIPVIYYGVPQLWAWAPWRVGKMRRLIDFAFCKLPFEAQWFQARGVHAEFVGHPYYDELESRQLDPAFLRQWRQSAAPLVTLLPGSRDQEVEGHTSWLLDAAAIVRDRHPECRFAFACFSEDQAELVRRLSDNRLAGLEILVGRTPELIELATCAIACSGSVSLELLYHRTPAVIFYRVGVIGYALQHLLRTSRYITLGNLMVADSIERRPFEQLQSEEQQWLPFPEYVSPKNCSRQLAHHIDRWLADPDERQRKIAQLQELRDQFAVAGASQRAADRIQAILAEARRSPIESA